MEYRRAKTSDHKHILPLAEAFAHEQAELHPHLTLAENAGEYITSGLAQALAAPTACVVVAEQDGQVVGYAVGQMQEPPPVYLPEAYIFLSDLYAAPEFRAEGVLQALVERVRGWGLINGIARFSSVAMVGSEQAMALRDAGYAPMQELYFMEIKD